jgi:hypothetical protein
MSEIVVFIFEIILTVRRQVRELEKAEERHMEPFNEATILALEVSPSRARPGIGL